MDQTIKDALRIAKSPHKPVRFHHTVARKGYQVGGHPEDVVEEKEEIDIDADDENAADDTSREPKRPAYKRLVNPAGFYSRAHEVAMTELPEGEHDFSNLFKLLKEAPNLTEEEIRMSGILPDLFSHDRKLTREEIAEIIERNFPTELEETSETELEETENPSPDAAAESEDEDADEDSDDANLEASTVQETDIT